MFLHHHSNSNYHLLASISGVDYPEREERFEIVYDLLYIRSNSRIRIKTQTDKVNPLPSVVGSACPLHTITDSGRGKKEAHIIWSMVMHRQHPLPELP